MLDWYEPLYIGNNAKKKAEKYKKKLDQGKVLSDIFLITFSSGPEDQLEIIHSFYLIQNALYIRCPRIVGLAKGYEEALELVLQIAEETAAETGTGNIKDYLLQR